TIIAGRSSLPAHRTPPHTAERNETPERQLKAQQRHERILSREVGVGMKYVLQIRLNCQPGRERREIAAFESGLHSPDARPRAALLSCKVRTVVRRGDRRSQLIILAGSRESGHHAP